MKFIYTLLLLSTLMSVQGQSNNTQPQSKLPDIVPPSPTVASLMKFEEIAVDNYTGTPNINIPLYSFILDAQLSLEMSLSYSSTGIKVDDIPGWAGCGWALNVGGSISRTMIGKPDDDIKGIFNNGFFNLNNFTDEEKQTFYWNANRFKWDTEHDLFQYNFMGKTGRFYLKKDAVTGLIVPIDLNGDSKHIIAVTYNNTNNKILEITITDEFGYKYYFNNYDLTTSMSSSQQNIEPYDQYISAWHLTEIKNHNDVILCKFLYTLVSETSRTPTSYSYNEIVGEVITNIPSVENESISYLPAVASSFMMNQNQVSVLSEIIVPRRGKVYFSTLTRTQNLNLNPISYSGYKLKEIRIDDNMSNMIKKFNFTLPAIQPSEKIFLTQIEELVPGGQSHLYKLNYKDPQFLPVFDSKQKDYWGYFNSNTTNTLSPYHGAIRDVDATKVTYGVLESIEYPTGGKKVFQFESNTYSYLGSRSLNPNDIEEIPENFTPSYKTWDVVSSQSNNNTIVHFEGNQLISVNLKAINFYSGNPQDITGYKLAIKPVTPNFYIDPNGAVQEFDPLAFSEDDPNSIFARNEYGINIADCGDFTQLTECVKDLNLKGWYSFQIVQDNYLSMQPITYRISFYYRKKTGNQKFTLGGGLRIRKVKFTDTNQNIAEVLYNYNLTADNTMSSGSQSLKPKKQGYNITRDLMYYHIGNNALVFSFIANGASYFIYDDQSGLDIPLDKGSYIGYKNVSVRKVQSVFSDTTNPFNPIVEIDNFIGGKQEYNYTSPIDFPDYDSSYEWEYPFIKSPSLDFKRGLLLESKTYDESMKLLAKEVNEYNYFSNQISLGFSQKEKEFLDCPMVNEYSSHSAFKEGYIETYRMTGIGVQQPYQYGLDIWNLHFNGSDIVTDGDAESLCPKATRYLYQINNVQVVGWAKLVRKTSSNYFYEGNQSAEVFTTQIFDYNANKLIRSVVTEMSSNASLETKYFYANDLSNQLLINKNMIAIPLKTEYYKNGEKTATQNTYYKDWGNGYVGLDAVQESKGSSALGNRIEYNLIDNVNGNIQQVSMVGGMPISYVWGYNKTLPVAKLENIAYANIPSNLITNIQTITNSPTATETEIQAALDALRLSTDPNMQMALITTYRYKPLVGVTNITDPKGDSTTYRYDDFNRLIEVRDRYNNIISEHEYHYRTQN